MAAGQARRQREADKRERRERMKAQIRLARQEKRADDDRLKMKTNIAVQAAQSRYYIF